jgi:hypothetical protein
MNGEEAQVGKARTVQRKIPRIENCEAIEEIRAAAKETRPFGEETAGGS